MARTAPDLGGNDAASDGGPTFGSDPRLTPVTPPLGVMNGPKTISGPARRYQPGGDPRGAPRLPLLTGSVTCVSCEKWTTFLRILDAI